jgi:hypothetical protein
MLKSILSDSFTGKSLSTGCPTGEELELTTNTHAMVKGMFYSASRSAAGTTTIVTPKLSAGLSVTDLVMEQDKAANAVLTVQFTDGTNTVPLMVLHTIDAPLTIAIPFAGRIIGWRDARIDMVTVGDANANVLIGFYRIPHEFALPYSEWLAERTG